MYLPFVLVLQRLRDGVKKDANCAALTMFHMHRSPKPKIPADNLIEKAAAKMLSRGGLGSLDQKISHFCHLLSANTALVHVPTGTSDSSSLRLRCYLCPSPHSTATAKRS